MKSLHHASRLVALALLALACATANAALIVNVEGVRGSGKTTWTLSGSSNTGIDGTTVKLIRTGTGSNNFSAGDTLEASDNGQFLSDTTTVGENSLFAVTGSAQVTVGSRTQGATKTITHVFFDPNQGITGDYFGIRVNRFLHYRSDAISRWSGSFTLDLDIGNFKLGTYQLGSTAGFANNITLNFKETARVPEAASVPDPSSLALLGLALAGLRFSRKLTSAQSRA